jgi:predicted helicase
LNTYDFELDVSKKTVSSQPYIWMTSKNVIINDPNNLEDERWYIVRLIGQVITVSLETVEIVKRRRSRF